MMMLRLILGEPHRFTRVFGLVPSLDDKTTWKNAAAKVGL
jgi:hypothetical protein